MGSWRRRSRLVGSLVLWLALLSSLAVLADGFTCQGNTYEAALRNCPDSGSQKLSAGGNVTVLVKAATNLPNRDFTGTSAGVSDPYVKLSVGRVSAQTRTVYNNLNPEWNERINIGVLSSATAVTVEIWDEDTGMEFGDDLIARTLVRVPFCSTFSANYTRQTCSSVFGCEVDDSLWKSPYRQLCNETDFVAFSTSTSMQECFTNGVCVILEFNIVPFQVDIELVNEKTVQYTPALSVFGNPAGKADWSLSFGAPFLRDGTKTLDVNLLESESLLGAIIIQQYNDEKSKGNANTARFYASINFPAKVYVCRDTEDDEFGIPKWITSNWNDRNVSVTRVGLVGSTTVFECFYRYEPGTTKNKYGGVIGNNYLTFYTNTIPGYDTNQNTYIRDYNYMYIVLALPIVTAAREEVITIVYDAALFIQTIFSYGLVWWIFFYFIVRLLSKINYRPDRILTYVATRMLGGTDKNLIASLFLTMDQSPMNIEYRGYLTHLQNIYIFFFIVPYVLMIGWGIACAAIARPAALGYALIFIGCAAMTLWVSVSCWEINNWRMSPLTLTATTFSIIMFICYIIAIVFLDPAVVLYDRSLNFSALSLVFGTINVIPLMFLVFKQDKSLKISMKSLSDKMSDAIFKIKNPAGRIPTNKKYTPSNKLLHALLGEGYTINPRVPFFSYATVLPEPPKELFEQNPTRPVKSTEPSTAEEDEGNQDSEKSLYNSSLVILFVYLMIAISRTNYPSLAFLNCLTLMLFDTIHSALTHGTIKWSPGYSICLLVAGRILIMGSTGGLWIFTYSLAYLVYSLALLVESINNFLPMLSNRQAGEIAFGGVESNIIASKNVNDIAGTAHFCLGLLTFAFIAILVVAAHGDVEYYLPTPDIVIWNASWPIYVFGLIAILITIVTGFLVSTSRAFYLEKHGLLRGWAKESYMLRKYLNIPIVLAIFSELSIIASGILIYSITHSKAVLIICIFAPVVVACFAYCYGVWVKNDFDLIVWPPVEEKHDKVDDSPSDMEVAFHMIENLFGEEGGNGNDDDERPETDDGPGEKTLKGFKLPPLEATATKVDNPIKMPPLPLKSVLRRKRQNLGIKVKNPLVKDLKARDDADDADKFGTGDVIDANDLWGKFEVEDDDSDKKKKRKRTDWSQYVMAERGGFYNHPLFVMVREKVMSYTVTRILFEKLYQCFSFLHKRAQSYAKITFKDADEEVEDGEEEKKEEKDEGPAHENFAKMPFWSAAFSGYLSWAEYRVLIAWFMGLFLTMIMGIALSKACNPEWLGHVIWVAIWMGVLTFTVVYKYFNTYKIDKTMKDIMYFIAFFHFMFCVCFFGAELNGDVTSERSLWILDYFFYYPTFLYLVVEFYIWVDNGYIIEKLDKDGDGNITFNEYVQYFKAYPAILIMMILLNWQFYLWINIVLGQVATICFLTAAIGYIFIRDWAVNDFFISREFGIIGSWILNIILFFTFFIGLFSASNPIFSFSVFFFTLIFKYTSRIVTRFIIADKDTIVYFSPFIMPVYSYDPRTNSVVDETPVAKDFILVLTFGALWGALMAGFIYPVHIGVCIACVFLLVIAVMLCSAISYIPMQMGRLASMMTLDSIAECAATAKEAYIQRKLPLNLLISDWEGAGDDWTEKQKSVFEKLKEKSSLEIAAELMSDIRAVTHVPDDDDGLGKKVDEEEEEEKVVPWWQEYLNDFIDQFQEIYDSLPLIKYKGWKRHSECLFTPMDILAEGMIACRGPVSFLGLSGSTYNFLKQAQEQPNLKWFKMLTNYDSNGNCTDYVQLSEHLHISQILSRYPDLDNALDYTYMEETRCAIHFLLLIIASADAKLEREKVLFQKFLRENRFRLASNGISPPAEIFSSSSFASIDIPLVAAWLSTLSNEEKERFHMLKATFSDEQKERDIAIDAADYEKAYEALQLKQSRVQREKEVADGINRELAKRQQGKMMVFAESLTSTDRSRFAVVKDEWLNNSDIMVHPKDATLYEKFRAAIFSGADESTEYAREVLAEIEAAQKDCRMGEYGRAYQFVDSDFPPGDVAIGFGDSSQFILGWRCAPGISDTAQLFDTGTEPDDVFGGIFHSEWILSAVTMLAATDNEGKAINPQISQLFIGHYGNDGELTFHTEVGGYCVRLYKQGIWNPVVIDDCLPMLRHDNWTNENRGLAGAHTKECTKIWVALIEKAFAKYYGNYTELSQGFVHHALEDLTGSESECTTLAHASRGAGKRALWDQLVRFRKNGYILGAGTGAAALADKEIQDMGIVFNAAYTIYEIKEVDGHKLLKLRNPPGDHEEWKGDWSDKSTLWTRRLKYKLGHTDADDNTFFMSFDDFCNVFRELYICKWYNPKKWITQTYPGLWKKGKEESVVDLKKKQESEEDEVDPDEKKRLKMEEEKKKAYAKVDTTGGLCCKDNPSCIFENNPQYSLLLHRPTDIKITVNQADSHGRASVNVHPFTIIVARNSHPTVATRVTSLDKDNLVCTLEEPTRDRQTSLYAFLNPGLYIVIIPTYVSGLEGNFSLSLLSNYKCDLTPIWPPKWMTSSGLDGSNAAAVLEELKKYGGEKTVTQIKNIGKSIQSFTSSIFGGADESDDEAVDNKYAGLNF